MEDSQQISSVWGTAVRDSFRFFTAVTLQGLLKALSFPQNKLRRDREIKTKVVRTY